MVGWHTVIGIGEAVDHRPGGRQRGRRPPRPRLRRPPGARRARTLEIRTAQAASEHRMSTPRASSSPASLVALLVAGVAQLLRQHPPRRPRVRRRADRLPRHRRGLTRPPTARSPTTQTKGVDDERLSGGARRRRRRRWSCSVLGGGLFWSLRRGAPTTSTDADDADSPSTAGPDGRRARPPAALPRPQRRSTGPRRTSSSLALVGFMLVVVATPRELVRRVRRLPASSCSAWSRCRGCRWRYLAQADGDRGAVRAVRGAGAVRRRTARRSRCSASPSPSPGCSPRRAAGQGHARRARLADPGRDHRAAGRAARPAAAADAGPDRADHGLHDPLPRRGHRPRWAG